MIGPEWTFRNIAFVLVTTALNFAVWLHVAPAALRKMRNWHTDASERRMDATAPSWHAEHSKPDEITGLAKVEADALALLRYHHKYGKRMTRRQAQRKWGWTQDTWNKAHGCAKSAGCYDDADELTVDLNEWQTVLDMVQEWRMTQAELDRLGNFVSAR